VVFGRGALAAAERFGAGFLGSGPASGRVD
jgi:hypothetical protein